MGTRKYLAFDIETAKETPGDFAQWRDHRPLGICCAATIASDAETPTLWHSKASNGSPASRMTQPDLQALVNHLRAMATQGYTILTWLGFPIGLEKVAQGLDLPGKAAGMSGGEAPKLWAQGEYEKVLAYVAQDVRLALQIALECERRSHFAWITQRGMKKTEPLPGGWKTVREALKMPLPDTSWMKTPLLREDMLAWMAGD
jgi:hypothetical protein